MDGPDVTDVSRLLSTSRTEALGGRGPGWTGAWAAGGRRARPQGSCMDSEARAPCSLPGSATRWPVPRPSCHCRPPFPVRVVSLLCVVVGTGGSHRQRAARHPCAVRRGPISTGSAPAAAARPPPPHPRPRQLRHPPRRCSPTLTAALIPEALGPEAWGQGQREGPSLPLAGAAALHVPGHRLPLPPPSVAPSWLLRGSSVAPPWSQLPWASLSGHVGALRAGDLPPPNQPAKTVSHTRSHVCVPGTRTGCPRGRHVPTPGGRGWGDLPRPLFYASYPV